MKGRARVRMRVGVRVRVRGAREWKVRAEYPEGEVPGVESLRWGLRGFETRDRQEEALTPPRHSYVIADFRGLLGLKKRERYI